MPYAAAAIADMPRHYAYAAAIFAATYADYAAFSPMPLRRHTLMPHLPADHFAIPTPLMPPD